MTTAESSTLEPYTPQGAAFELLHCREREILIEGPAGTGKTRAILEKVNAIACKYPNSRILLCRKTRKSLSESALVTFEEKVLPPNASLKQGPTRSHRDKYTYPNGSELILGGLDHAERLFSTEFDVVVIFEATEATLDDYESLHRSLRNNIVPYQQIICDCNPSYPSHWLNQRANVGKMTRLLSRHKDNPTLTPEYLDTLSELSGPRRDRLYLGKWVAAEGAVYSGFDSAVHIVDRRAIPDDWRRIRSVDYGYTNPATVQWWAVDNDGRMYLYRELYRCRRLCEDVTRDAVSLTGDENIEATVADHDAEDRATMARYGIPTSPANKAVTVGIQAVTDRLRPAGDGRPRLFLMRDSLVERDPVLEAAKRPCCLAEEIESYLWQESREGRADKEEPVKVDDHGCDAMRYACMYLDAGSMASMCWVTGEEPETRTPEEWCCVDNPAVWEAA